MHLCSTRSVAIDVVPPPVSKSAEREQSMATQPASSLRPGGWALLNGDVSCRIDEVETAGEGKLQSGQVIIEEFDAGQEVLVPIVTRKEYQLVEINAADNNLVTLLDLDSGNVVDDLRVPGDPAYQPLLDASAGAGERSLYVTVMGDQNGRWILPQFAFK
ncbi:hypothetical protein DFJ74DRAFT_75044 [Hyaloraphidium curvatum]|nr:hypothetical protein DFJ74DRAFT_75044 [Hyaloraphidium curvatum]